MLWEMGAWARRRTAAGTAGLFRCTMPCLPTAGETIVTLRNLGRRTVFLSNNPTHSRADYAAKLTRLGLPTASADVINSTVVMVDFLKGLYARSASGAPRLFVVGEEPLMVELGAAGFDRTFVYR
jgi:arabinose operon protein AraL